MENFGLPTKLQLLEDILLVKDSVQKLQGHMFSLQSKYKLQAVAYKFWVLLDCVWLCRTFVVAACLCIPFHSKPKH